MRGGAFRQGRTTMSEADKGQKPTTGSGGPSLADELRELREHLRAALKKADHLLRFDDGGVTTQDDGGTGDPTPPPKN
jgi:hypothetical protein